MLSKSRYEYAKKIRALESGVFDLLCKYFSVNEKLEFEEKIDYLSDIYSTIVLKDIISKNNIRDIAFLERLIKFMIFNGFFCPRERAFHA